MTDSAGSLVITEVGPRDGLQNEQQIVPVEIKIELIDRLAGAGLPEIEVSAFVRPDVVPQLADAAEVFAGLQRRAGTVYSALVPNERGLLRAIESGAQKVSVFTAASETFAVKNTNATIAETVDRFRPVAHLARERGIPMRAYVSCVVACPYEGPVEPHDVMGVIEQLQALGDMEIDLGDTIGAAEPSDIERLLECASESLRLDDLVLHLHDTRGSALPCARRAMELGVRRFDAAVGGLGGCPFAPGAPGNLATESLLTLCDEMGFETGVDAVAVAEIGRWIRGVVGRVC